MPPADGSAATYLPGDKSIQRILVMKWSALGDVALASAAFEDIHRAFPGAVLDLNTLPPMDAYLFADDPRFRRIISIDLRGRERNWRGKRRWLRDVREGGYDLIIDMQSNDRSRFLMTLLFLSGAAPRYRLGMHQRFPYNLAPGPQPRPVHALTHIRAMLASAGIPVTTPRPVLHAGPDHRERAARLLTAHDLDDGGFAVFLPGCQRAGYLKRWGARRYASLALSLHGTGMKTVLLGAADEMDECQEIGEAAGDCVVNLCGKTEILDVIPICECAAFVVGNDTGTAHVASVADRPMVVLCGPTDPRRVKPAGDNVVSLQAGIHCINCYRKHCSHQSCMALISPDDVLSVFRDPASRRVSIALRAGHD